VTQVPSGYYYVASLKLQFELHRSRVVEIRRLPKMQKSWLAVDADRLDVTDSSTHFDVDRRKLNLDGLGLLMLINFLLRQNPGSSRKANRRRLIACFPNSAFFPEVFKGSLYAAMGMDHAAVGDITHFASAARAAHPLEFAALNEFYRTRASEI
jgi:hypothetical protein